jgi:hypothetical protein
LPFGESVIVTLSLGLLSFRFDQKVGTIFHMRVSTYEFPHTNFPMRGHCLMCVRIALLCWGFVSAVSDSAELFRHVSDDSVASYRHITDGFAAAPSGAPSNARMRPCHHLGLIGLLHTLAA